MINLRVDASGQTGIYVGEHAHHNVIGGVTRHQTDIIRNSKYGIEVEGKHVRIMNTQIATNALRGIVLNTPAEGAQIGHGSVMTIIAKHGYHGILCDAPRLLVVNTRLGIDVAGNQAPNCDKNAFPAKDPRRKEALKMAAIELYPNAKGTRIGQQSIKFADPATR